MHHKVRNIQGWIHILSNNKNEKLLEIFLFKMQFTTKKRKKRKQTNKQTELSKKEKKLRKHTYNR